MKFEILLTLAFAAGCGTPAKTSGDLAMPGDSDLAGVILDMTVPPGSDLFSIPDLFGADLKFPPAPAFALVDVNPNSATKTQLLGPSTFAGKAMAFIFLEAS